MPLLIEIPSKETDSPAYMAQVNALLNDELIHCTPGQVYIIQIDHAFDHKWLGYSGNPIQHLAVWKRLLTLPPFHPNRVKWQRAYKLSEPGKPFAYVERDGVPLLHIRQQSQQNLDRYLRDVSNSAIFVWMSGDTQRSGLGTVMIYWALPNFTDKWFATLRADNGWKMAKHRRISVAAQ